MTEQSAAPTGAAAPTETTWTTGFDDDSVGFVQNKGWNAPGDVVKAYRELESFRGVPADQLIKMPKDYSDPDSWGDVYNKLGRPDDAEGYQLSELEDKLIDDDGAFRAMMHKAGLSQNQAAIIHDELNAMLGAQIDGDDAAAEADFESAVQADLGQLEQEWGQDFDRNIAMGQQAVQRFGIDEDTLNAMESAMGTKSVLSLMQRIGSGMGESGFVDGNTSYAGAMTKEMASAKLLELRGNSDFSKRLLGGDQAANAEIDKLTRIKAGLA